jgi:hypothetical protein
MVEEQLEKSNGSANRRTGTASLCTMNWITPLALTFYFKNIEKQYTVRTGTVVPQTIFNPAGSCI